MALNTTHIDMICHSTDDRLWGAYSRSLGAESISLDGSHLVFPIYSGRRDGELRVSEQEARFAFTESIATTPYYYSVETPTREGYQLTGSKPLSAQTDLTLYDADRQPILNVEFKAKGVSASARNLFSIQKDVQKLLREPTDGMWFHILEAVDNSTISKLFETLARALSETASKFKSYIQEKHLIFHLCILKQQFSLNKHIELSPEKMELYDFKRLFHFSYNVTRSSLLKVRDIGGWHVHKLE